MARSTSITIRNVVRATISEVPGAAVSAVIRNQMMLPPNSDICQNVPGTYSTHWKASALQREKDWTKSTQLSCTTSLQRQHKCATKYSTNEFYICDRS